jgi:ribosome modulation factor
MSRHYFWNAFNCGYQAFRQGKLFGANPYYNDELETRWSEGWKAAQKACRTGKEPFDLNASVKQLTAGRQIHVRR